MAAERRPVASLSDAELDELARRLCAVLHSAYLRQHALQHAAGRAPQHRDTRPRAAREEAAGVGNSTVTPRAIVHR